METEKLVVEKMKNLSPSANKDRNRIISKALSVKFDVADVVKMLCSTGMSRWDAEHHFLKYINGKSPDNVIMFRDYFLYK